MARPPRRPPPRAAAPAPAPAARPLRPPRPGEPGGDDEVERPPRRPGPQGPEGQRLYGVAAALAVLARRPQAILAVDHTRDAAAALAPLLAHAVARKLPVQERSAEVLARLAGALHHEGVCLTVKPLPLLSLRALTEHLHAGAGGRPAGAALALDGVGNPHNLGAILRSAAYFGVRALILADDDKQAQLTPAALRIAEGGAEYVPVARVPSLAPALRHLADSGVTVIGTDARAGAALGPAWPRPCVVVLGSERHGMAPAVRAACSQLVAIPGAGVIDSLNVSVAAGILLAHLAHGATPA